MCTFQPGDFRGWGNEKVNRNKQQNHTLPWCQWKMSNKSEKTEIVIHFFPFFFFELGCERVVIKTHNNQSRLVIGSKITLFARKQTGYMIEKYTVCKKVNWLQDRKIHCLQKK